MRTAQGPTCGIRGATRTLLGACGFSSRSGTDEDCPWLQPAPRSLRRLSRMSSSASSAQEGAKSAGSALATRIPSCLRCRRALAVGLPQAAQDMHPPRATPAAAPLHGPARTSFWPNASGALPASSWRVSAPRTWATDRRRHGAASSAATRRRRPLSARRTRTPSSRRGAATRTLLGDIGGQRTSVVRLETLTPTFLLTSSHQHRHRHTRARRGVAPSPKSLLASGGSPPSAASSAADHLHLLNC